MPRYSRRFGLGWPAYAVMYSLLVIWLFLLPIVPFDDPWPLSLIIALLALLMLIWIPMISWLIRQRQGIAWSVRALPTGADVATRSARLAIWNSGFQAVRNRSGTRNDSIVLRIEGRDPATTIVDINVDPTQAEPIHFNIRLSPDNRRVELSTPGIPMRHGTIFTIEHTGAHGSDIEVTGEPAGARVTYFPPGDIVIPPTWNTLLKHPSAILGVLILLSLTLFWLHEGRTALTLALHSAFMGLVLGTITSIVAIIYQSRANQRPSERSLMRLVGLPVGLQRFFDNG